MVTSNGCRGWIVMISSACLAAAWGSGFSSSTRICSGDEPAKAAADTESAKKDDKKADTKTESDKKEDGKKDDEKKEVEKKDEGEDPKKKDASKPSNPLEELVQKEQREGQIATPGQAARRSRNSGEQKARTRRH